MGSRPMIMDKPRLHEGVVFANLPCYFMIKVCNEFLSSALFYNASAHLFPRPMVLTITEGKKWQNCVCFCEDKLKLYGVRELRE